MIVHIQKVKQSYEEMLKIGVQNEDADVIANSSFAGKTYLNYEINLLVKTPLQKIMPVGRSRA